MEETSVRDLTLWDSSPNRDEEKDARKGRYGGKAVLSKRKGG